jgi:CHAD domain
MAQTQSSSGSPFAHGVAVFAGVVLIIGGGFQAIQGLAAIVHDQYIVVLPNYIYAFDLTAWGWIHLLIGVGLVAIGIFVLRGQTWARVAGMVLAGISALLIRHTRRCSAVVRDHAAASGWGLRDRLAVESAQWHRTDRTAERLASEDDAARLGEGRGGFAGRRASRLGRKDAAQCDVLASNDVGMRTGTPDGHKTRVAARRLRSTLRIFDDVVDAAPAEELDNELKWYADLLGQVRDRDILSSRWSSRSQTCRRSMCGGRLKPRSRRLSMRNGRTPYTGWTRRYVPGAISTSCSCCAAGGPHLRSRTPPVRTARQRSSLWKRPSKRRTNDYGRPTTLNSCIGPGRRSNGRGTPLNSSNRPTAMKSIARDAQEMQTLLGEHQDAVVAATFLATTSADEDIEAGSAFTYGVLMANELNRAAEIRASVRN